MTPEPAVGSGFASSKRLASHRNVLERFVLHKIIVGQVRRSAKPNSNFHPRCHFDQLTFLLFASFRISFQLLMLISYIFSPMGMISYSTTELAVTLYTFTTDAQRHAGDDRSRAYSRAGHGYTPTVALTSFRTSSSTSPKL